MLLFNEKTPKQISFNKKSVREVLFNGISVWIRKIIALVTGKAPLELPLSVGEDIVNYKVHGESKQVRMLPAEYQQVEYIEATGKQYLEIDYVASNITTTKGSFQLTEVTTGLMLFGSRESSNTGGLSYALNWGGELPYKYYNSFNRVASSSLTDKEIDLDKHTFEKAKNKLYMDGELIHTVTNSTFTTPYNMIVFGCNNKGKAGYLAKAKIFDLQFYDNNEIKVDLIPCYRKSDKVIGMYDLVTRSFYTNQGTDVFLMGEAISPYQDTHIPTPNNPIEIQSVGDYDATTGKYKVPVSINGNITNIYLNEPLRRVGEYADYIDYENQQIVRKVGCYTFDGSEDWILHTTTEDDYGVFRIENVIEPLIGAPTSATFMTHFAFTDIVSTASWGAGWYRNAQTTVNGEIVISSNRLYVSGFQSTVNDFKEWLSVNKPSFIYPLPIAIEEAVELPALETVKDTNLFEIHTTIEPNYVEVSYYKKA